MTSLSTSTPSQSKMTRSKATLSPPPEIHARSQACLPGVRKPEPVKLCFQSMQSGSETKKRKLRRGVVVIERNAIQLEPVIDQLVAEPAGDFRLQLLDFFGGEFDHLAVAQIDQVVVMAVAHLFIAGAALAEVVPLDDTGIFEQLDGSIDRRDRDLVIDRDAAAIQFLDVRMIQSLRQHARDDAALFGHAHAGGGAARFDTGGLERGRGFQGGHDSSAFGKD